MKTTRRPCHDQKHQISRFPARHFLPLLCLGMGCLLMVVVTAQTNAPSKNILPNGSFELEAVRAGKPTPEGWGFFQDEKTYQGFYVDDKNQVHSGEKAVSIIGDETSLKSAMWLTLDFVEVTPGAAYSVEGWIKTSECTGKGAWLWVNAYEKKDGEAVGVVAFARPVIFCSGTEDWQEWSAQIHISKNVRWLRIACRLDGPGNAWFDDLQVSKSE